MNVTCGAQFAHSKHLKEHMHTHTDEKPYTCDICGAQCAHSKHLRRHLHTHIGNSLINVTCGAQFGFSRHLKGHLHTHTGEKPFK